MCYKKFDLQERMWWLLEISTQTCYSLVEMAKSWSQWYGSLALVIIKRPTRVSATSKTLIDLILVNNDSKVAASGVVHYSIADDKFTYAV